jgi:hypothetical protein
VVKTKTLETGEKVFINFCRLFECAGEFSYLARRTQHLTNSDEDRQFTFCRILKIKTKITTLFLTWRLWRLVFSTLFWICRSSSIGQLARAGGANCVLIHIL